MRTVETAVSALTEPARRQKGPTQAPTRFRRRRADQTAWPARTRRRLSERQVQGLEALFALRAIAQQVDDVPTGCGHGGSNPNPVRRDRPLRRTSEAAIADQILCVPRAARRQRDHAIEQRAPSLEEPKVCRLSAGGSWIRTFSTARGSELSSFAYVTQTVRVITSPSRSRRPVSIRVIRLETSKNGVKRGDASSIPGQAVGGA